MKTNFLKSFCRNAGLTLVGSVALAGATASQPEKAAAINLNFGTTTQTQTNTNPFNANLGPGVGNTGPSNSNNPTGSTAPVVVNYTSIAPGVDARVTATAFGTNYSFVEHVPNYSVATGQPTGDTGALYQIAAGQTGRGGVTYQIDLFENGSNFTTALLAPELRFLVYDVDGEATQNEAVRIFKGAGLVGYQVGSSTAALIPTQDATSYLFSGRNVNQPENDTSGAATFRFQNVNSVLFQFEANTTTSSTNNNGVFSGIDGDLSYLPSFAGTFASEVDTSATAVAQAVPEPFTVIGSIIGGTVAFRMRKKLKASNKA